MGRTDLDSHADSPVVGINAKILSYTDKHVNVWGFSKTLGSRSKVPVVNAAITYTCEYSGESIVLLVNNALYFEEMKHNLIPPFMIRLAGAEVNECPKCLSRHPRIEDHSIYFPNDENHSEGYRIPLQLHGTISYLPTNIPTSRELVELTRYNLTPDTPEWNPHTDVYGNQEHSMLNYQGELVEKQVMDRSIFEVDMAPTSSADMHISEIITSINSNYCPEQFSKNLIMDNNTSAVWSGRRRGITAHQLSNRWNISPKLAQKTIEATTQLCIRSADMPSLSRRFKANDRMLRYPRITDVVFTDTFFAKRKGLKSAWGNTCCQVFVTEHNYVTVKSMVSRKSGFPKALKAFFKEEGVPPAIIADGAKEQVRGESLKLCQQVGCEIRELEQGTPFSNRAERYVGILKEKVLMAMKQSNSPMKLWDYCVEWCAKVLSSTAHDHFQLDGTTPKSKLTGQPTDISNLCEFEWYEWVQFRYANNQFPEPHEHLGRCLGPAQIMLALPCLSG